MLYKGEDISNRLRVTKTKQKQMSSQKPLIFQDAINTSSLMLSSLKPITNTSSANHTPSVRRDVRHKDTPINYAVATPDSQSASTEISSSSIEDCTSVPTHDISTSMSHAEKGILYPRYFAEKPIIEVPVLIARADIEVDLISRVDIPYPVISVTDIRWHVHSLNSHLLLPTNQLIVNGVITVYIEYQTVVSPNKLHATSTNLIWRREQTVKFLHPPIVPVQREFKVYTFQNSQTQELTTHREHVEQLYEKPFPRLRLSRIVATEKTQSDGKTSHISLKVNSALSIDVLQVQLINYSCKC